ncbi:MAG: HD-GYP domain-containing protein [Chthonomonas sp.]|nr:HD-GYP domain-containing protein [Chthonomonas sp.]
MFQNILSREALYDALSQSEGFDSPEVAWGLGSEQSPAREVVKLWDPTVRVLVNAIEAKSPYTRGHSERVMILATIMGRELGMDAQQLETLARGSLLHDIGKIGIPDVILEKPGTLSEAEYTVIKMHPVIGDVMLANVPEMASIRDIVRHHHEKLDGSGYPDQLAGEEVSREARIVAVADICDALLSNRSYRSSMNTQQAAEILRYEAAVGKLDPEVVEILANIFERVGRSKVEPAKVA